MRAFPVWAGIAVAISLNAEAQTPPPLLARASPTMVKFTSGEGWVPAIEKYKKELYDRVYAQWLAQVKAHEAKLKIGTVRVGLTIIETGKIRDLRILSTGASRRLEKLTLDAINHTEIAPPPLLTTQSEIYFELTFRLLQH
jgi:outer membrane biosynthesis protein TonB